MIETKSQQEIVKEVFVKFLDKKNKEKHQRDLLFSMRFMRQMST